MTDIPCFSISTGDGAYAIDDAQRIVFWNRAAQQLLGYSSSEILGRPCWQILAGCSRDGQRFCQPSCPVLAAINGGELVQSFDLIVNRRDGSQVAINVSSIVCSGLNTYNSPKDQQPSGILHLFRLVEEASDNHRVSLRVSLMGPTQVRLPDGSQVDGPLWRRVKVRSLLALLVLRRGHPIDRQTLLSLLWPDLKRSAALRNLNTTVYNLRHSLEPQLAHGADSAYIHYKGGKYWLSDERAIWVDIDAFRWHVSRARESSQTVEAIELYQQALDLRRGRFLADLHIAGLPELPEIAEFNQLYLCALEELGLLHIQLGEDGSATSIFERVLSLDPSRQSAMQQLIHLNRGLDERATSLAYCQQLVNTLQGELDVLLRQESFDAIG